MLTPGFIPLPGARIPVYPLFPDHEEGSPFGWTPMFDLMAPQEAYDSIISTMVTAHDATGIPNLWTQRGDRLQAKDLSMDEITIHALYDEHVSRRRDRSFLLWKLLNFLIWANQTRVCFTS